MECSYRLMFYCKVAGEWPIVEFGQEHDFSGSCLEELFDKISFLFPSKVIDHIDVYISYPHEPDFYFCSGRIYGFGKYRIFETYVSRLLNRRSPNGKKKR